MIEKEQEEISLQTARREKAHADAQWMKQVEFYLSHVDEIWFM